MAGLARRVDRIKALAEELQEEHGQLHAFKCDLTVEEDIINAFKQIIKKLGDIHVLVNNAGVLTVTDLINGDTGKWKTVMGKFFSNLAWQTHKENRYQFHGLDNCDKRSCARYEEKRHRRSYSAHQ